MLLRQIFEPKLAQYTYLIGCQRTGEALLIDPLRDVDTYVDLAAEEGLRITAATETHIHADFLSGTRELHERLGVDLYLSKEGGDDWQYAWADGADPKIHLLRHGEVFHLGKIEIQAVHTPGHTPEHMSFLVTDRGSGASEPIAIASGDFVFVGDLGRPDLLESAAGVAGAMEPSARTLYQSVERFMELPDHLQVWPGHGAGSACGKALGAVPMSTVGYEKRMNAAIDNARRGEDVFIQSILEGQPEPPLYFADMKRLNRGGPPLLGELPAPRLLGAEELANVLKREEVAVVDTRRSRDEFFRAHLEGTLFAPLDRSFPTIAGSYIRSKQSIVLLIDPDDLEEAIRDLVRIGLDRVVGYASLAMLDDPALASLLRSTEVGDFGDVEKRGEGAVVLDVRRASEFASGAAEGALNIAHTRLLDRLDEVPVDAEIFVHCRTGARAAAAAALLERAGRRVHAVDDDIRRTAFGADA